VSYPTLDFAAIGGQGANYSFETVLLLWFATQVFAQSKSTSLGSLPTAKVPSTQNHHHHRPNRREYWKKRLSSMAIKAVARPFYRFGECPQSNLRIPAKEIAHSDLMSIKIEASFRWTVIC